MRSKKILHSSCHTFICKLHSFVKDHVIKKCVGIRVPTSQFFVYFSSPLISGFSVDEYNIASKSTSHSISHIMMHTLWLVAVLVHLHYITKTVEILFLFKWPFKAAAARKKSLTFSTISYCQSCFSVVSRADTEWAIVVSESRFLTFENKVSVKPK